MRIDDIHDVVIVLGRGFTALGRSRKVEIVRIRVLLSSKAPKTRFYVSNMVR